MIRFNKKGECEVYFNLDSNNTVVEIHLRLDAYLALTKVATNPDHLKCLIIEKAERVPPRMRKAMKAAAAHAETQTSTTGDPTIQSTGQLDSREGPMY